MKPEFLFKTNKAYVKGLLEYKERLSELSQTMNLSKIKFVDGSRDFVYYEFSSPYILGLASKIKSDLKNTYDIKNNDYILRTQVENSYNYQTKNTIQGYQFDVNNAYLSMLRGLGFISQSTYEYGLLLKKRGLSTAQAVGVAMLGEKVVIKYRNGKEWGRELVFNQYRPLFMMLRYFVISGIKQTLNEYFYKERINYFVDSFLVASNTFTSNLTLSDVSEMYNISLTKAVLQFDKSIQKYSNTTFHNIIEKCEPVDFSFEFKKKICTSLTYQKSELTGKNALSFYRDNDLTKKITYQ